MLNIVKLDKEDAATMLDLSLSHAPISRDSHAALLSRQGTSSHTGHRKA